MDKIIIGVIGCGNIANSAHIPAYMKNEKVTIKYFCDIIHERAEDAVEKYGCGKAVADYHEVLSDPEVKAVSVCTPNHMHATIAIDAMRAGKKVLCEKPAARTYEEALEMQKVQHETGQILNIGVVYRFDEHVNRIRKYIQEGRLGEIYHVIVNEHAHRSIPGLGGPFTTKALAGGGALIDWGVHNLDVVMYCLGNPKIMTVSGETFCKLGKKIEDYAYRNMWAGPPVLDGTCDVEESVTALIRTEGAVISFHEAWAENIDENEFSIDFLGDKGGIRMKESGEFVLYTVEHGAFVKYTPEGKNTSMFENEINAFVECVCSGEKLPSHIDSAIYTSRLMQAIYDSAELHKEITLEKA